MNTLSHNNKRLLSAETRLSINVIDFSAPLPCIYSIREKEISTLIPVASYFFSDEMKITSSEIATQCNYPTNPP